MDENSLTRAYRNAWILTMLAALFVIGFFLFVLETNHPGRPTTWDLGGTSFVPASSIAADGYYRAPLPAAKVSRGQR